jgi:hypothetical protein
MTHQLTRLAAAALALGLAGCGLTEGQDGWPASAPTETTSAAAASPACSDVFAPGRPTRLTQAS